MFSQGWGFYVGYVKAVIESSCQVSGLFCLIIGETEFADFQEGF